MYFSDFAENLIELRENGFLTGRFVNFAQKSNSSDRKSLTTYVLFRFLKKNYRAEKKRISHRPICEIRPKIEF